ncbi:hypothetical protein OAT18_01040 [Tenacibaculum sp.]|nr:hypothetical protein [Tenacibaculum sp.]
MKKTTFTVTFEDGETKTVSLNPAEKRDYIATVSPENFNGEYGIDWCKMNVNFSDIETFQEIKVNDISHKLDEATSQFVANPNSNEKQELIKKLYQAEKYHEKEYPVTWINLAKDKTATLNITANLINGTRKKRWMLLVLKKIQILK